MAKSPTTSIFIDKYHPKADGKCAISIKVTYNRIKRYYPTKYKLSPNEFSALFIESPKKVDKTTLQALISEEQAAIKIINDLRGRFTFSAFEKKYARKTGDDENLFTLMSERASELRKEGRISSAVTFECALNSLKSFHVKSKLLLEEVDKEFLTEYQKWMLGKDNSLTTIGIYIRNVRTIFNEAIAEDLSLRDLYPFGKGKEKYTIPTGRNIKKALTKQDIQAIYNYSPKSESESKAKDFWLFSYLANGINVKDIALLKHKDVNGNFIVFHRAKTANANKAKPIPISIYLTDEIKSIINKWGCQSIFKDNYIFPILKRGATPEEEYKTIQLFVAFINKNMRKIAANLNIDSRLTTYVSRHSNATILKRAGASPEFIKESYGHCNISTTENYLGSFEDETKKEWAKELTNFTESKAV